MKRALLVAALLASGCNIYSALDPSSYPTGLACSSAGTCPPGQSCNTKNVCETTGAASTTLADPPDLGAAPDAAPPDAR